VLDSSGGLGQAVGAGAIFLFLVYACKGSQKFIEGGTIIAGRT